MYKKLLQLTVYEIFQYIIYLYITSYFIFKSKYKIILVINNIKI